MFRPFATWSGSGSAAPFVPLLAPCTRKWPPAGTTPWSATVVEGFAVPVAERYCRLVPARAMSEPVGLWSST
jgi:hypothetical protein